MSYWRSEYDDGWWTFYKDGIEIKLDNLNFGDLIVDEINNANQRIAELEEANKYWSKRTLIGECWIPVSERLPEESDWYLPYYIGYRVTYPIYYDVKLGWYAEDKPDYWMPFPESPIVYG